MSDAGSIHNTAPCKRSRRRYPGVQPFQDSNIHRHLFRGRDAEKYDLLQLILAERLVVLFSRSGLGKSSLINAGLLEPLRNKGFFPMVVRVSGIGGPLDSLYKGVQRDTDEGIDQQWIEYKPNVPNWNKTSLWHFFKTFKIWRKDKLLTPVLIIDQFEELFTLRPPKSRKQFIDELADLARDHCPRNISEQNNTDAQKLSDHALDVKIVLSLREDFLANMEELAYRIPAIFKARFRLNPLAREQARSAIVEPAKLKNLVLSTPTFSWSENAQNIVLDCLCKCHNSKGKTTAGYNVEPFQLQLICQHVESLVLDKGLTTINSESLGGARANESLMRILNKFYEDSLDKICNKFRKDQILLAPKHWFDNIRLRPRLERLCEYGFITSRGRRLLREESTIKESDKVSPEILREMVDLRLLRREPRLGDNYYELTHDTLIEPILLSRQQRDQKRRRRTKLAFVILFLVTLLIGTALWQLAKIQIGVLQQQNKELIKQSQRQAATESFKLPYGSNSVVFRDPLQDGSKGPEMIVIPPGDFLIGSPSNERGRDSDEAQHSVTIEHAFAIGKYEVTMAEYDRYAKTTDRIKQRDNHPVVNVTWNDAVAYTEWLSKMTGKDYRLPTEAEWEYAARAGTETAYWWGKFVGRNNANCAGCGNIWSRNGSTPVSYFKANLWGLHSTAGNVWEWTCSEYRDPYDNAEKVCTDIEDAKGVIRGGSRITNPQAIRSANRYEYDRKEKFDYLGFRVARSK